MWSLVLTVYGPIIWPLVLISHSSSVALCQQSETSEVLESLVSFLRCLTDFSSSCRAEQRVILTCLLKLKSKGCLEKLSGPLLSRVRAKMSSLNTRYYPCVHPLFVTTYHWQGRREAGANPSEGGVHLGQVASSSLS